MDECLLVGEMRHNSPSSEDVFGLRHVFNGNSIGGRVISDHGRINAGG